MNHRYDDKRGSISEELNSEPRGNVSHGEHLWIVLEEGEKKKIFPIDQLFQLSLLS